MATVAAKDYYERIGVSQDASQDEIRQAYLKLARKYHPDKTGGDKAALEKLKEINAAYDTLKKPEKRKQYDEMLSSSFGSRPFGDGDQYQGFGGANGFGFKTSFEDLFGDLFGSGRPGRGPGPESGFARGADAEVLLSVSFREAASGATKTMRIPTAAPCKSCGGSGAEPGTKPQACPQCNGSGRLTRRNGAYSISQMCRACRGAGQVVGSSCKACGGSGHVVESRTVSIAIPPGADTGLRLRLPGLGEPGSIGAPNGDLYAVVKVLKDDVFERKGNDILCEAPIRFTVAALGGSIRVPTLDGQADLVIPAGTQPGRVFRLRGLGLPSIDGHGRGDQLVRVQVEVPTRLSREQKAILRSLRDAEADNS